MTVQSLAVPADPVPTSRDIQVRGVHKELGGALVIDDLSLTCPAGEVTVLLGPSGSGKSTLLRLLAGLERPDAGEIVVGGAVVAGPSTWIAPEKRRIGMVFQDWALFPHLDVAANVGFGVPRAERTAERVATTLELVGLGGMEQRAPHTLSGGQQQRVALARALAPRPDVLLLDEPFSNLDAALRRRLRSEVHELLVRLGMTTVFVTHDQDEAFVLGDGVAVVRDGRVVQLGTPTEIYRRPADRWVATFVGEANVLTGRIVGTGPDRRADTVLGRLPLDPDDDQHDGAVGDGGTAAGAVEVVVRPEQVALSIAGPSSPVVADVELVEYHGHDATARVRLADGSVLKARAPEITARRGDRVAVTFTGAPVRTFASR